MRWSQQSRRRRSLNRAIAPLCRMDHLESRMMLSGETVATPITPVLANIANPTSNNITLNQHFTDSVLPGTLVTFTTSEGTVQVGLTDAATPQTVANFLSYVNSGAYNNTIYHRSVDITTGLGATPTAPGTIIQGGGYGITSGSISHITTNGTVPDEFSTEVLSDTAGTLAMAKTSAANSGSSEFYFNVTDNTELDQPTADPTTGAETDYTVFGTVLSGMSVVNLIAAQPTINEGSGLETVPVTGINEAQAAAGASITSSNLIFNTSVTSEPGTSYTVTSSNKALVTPTVTNGVLSFAYSSTLFGTAEVTIKASNLDGTSTSSMVDVTVPNPATPSAGPVAADITAPFTQTGTTGNFSIVANDTDSLAALNPSTITIVTQPANGTATVDTSTGHINYTPNTGYIGADSLTYTIADTNGTTSNVATVTLSAEPGPVIITIGTAKAKSLTYTDPTGVIAHITVSGGTAAITFTDYRVTSTTKNGLVTATGLGAAITHIAYSNFGPPLGKIAISSNGPINIGSIFSPNTLASFIAPNATLTGTTDVGGILNLTVAAAINATISLGRSSPSGLNIANVSDTNITSIDTIYYIKAKQFLNTDGGTYSVTGINLLDLEVPGTFANNLTMNASGFSLYKANVGTPTGTWELGGSILKATIGTPGANFQIQSSGLITNLAVKGDFANSIQAAAIGTLTVSGKTTGATIQTDATFNKKFNQISKLAFTGAVANTVVFSAGNIGTISAPSMTNSRVYAGVAIGIAQAGALPAASNLSNDAKITAISLGNGDNAFSNALISADLIGTLKLGKIETANDGNQFGIAAHTISTLSATLVPGGIIKASAAQLKTAATLAAYEKAEKLALGDLTINLF